MAEIKIAKILGDKVLVKIDEKIKKSAGGVIMDNDNQTPSTKATVISVGTKVDESIKEGDRVIIPEYHPGNKINLDDTITDTKSIGKFIIMDTKDILGIVES